MSDPVLRAVSPQEELVSETNFEQDADIEVPNFMAALALLLRGTVGRFEQTSSKVTSSLMQRKDKLDRDLVMTLQDFDRLQQEFLALSNAFDRCAIALLDAGGRAARVERSMLATIAVSDLMERMLGHLEELTGERPLRRGDEEEVF